MPTFHFICLSIIYGFHQGPVFKSEVELFNHHWNAEAQENAGKNELEEQAHPVNKSEVKDSSNCSRNRKSKSKPRSDVVNNLTNERHKELPSADQASKIQTSPRRASPDKPPSIGELTRWISALIMNPRGLICTWSPPEHVVPIERNLKMKKFMINLILRTVMMHFCFQCVCAIGVEVLINSKADMDHFLFERLGLTPLTIIKSVSPFLLTMTLAGGIYSGFSLAGGLFNIVEIAAISILRLILPDNSSFRPDPVNPSNYPPLFNDPWCRTSLTEFWGKGWQAVFRHHLLFCGAQPMYNIFRRYGPTIGKFAAVMGAMGLSAAMHEFCLVSVSKIDPNFSSVRMFLSQGIGIVLEAIFKKFTGHKVSGPLGWVWTLGYMTLNGRPMVNAW
ncbi:hypothetical protein PtB15_8B232 [Puccinia triticina]|nr:hypothetical protein PtB15_8B232 [Puccinia triticina]